jgi:hypothetical protein
MVGNCGQTGLWTATDDLITFGNEGTSSHTWFVFVAKTPDHCSVSSSF